MKLQDFVKETLIEISQGVVEAQKELGANGSLVNPKLYNVFSGSQNGGVNLALGWDNMSRLVTMVDFDVAVTTQEGQGTKGGIGVVSGVFNVGMKGGSEKAQSAATRIKFSVPISHPSTE